MSFPDEKEVVQVSGVFLYDVHPVLTHDKAGDLLPFAALLYSGLFLVQGKALQGDDPAEFSDESAILSKDVLVPGEGDIVGIAGVTEMEPPGDAAELPVKVVANDVREGGGAGRALWECISRLPIDGDLSAAESGDDGCNLLREAVRLALEGFPHPGLLH